MRILKMSLLAFLSIEAVAQEADYELVTTGLHTVRSETALPVTVLSGEELHAASRATLGDTLANQPGINNASFGPAVGQTVIRGQQGRRVLNLSNGIANADASGNSADHAVSVEPILADAIEVLRGPSTLLYGGGAIGGVVNVIDNRIPRSLVGQPSLTLETRHDTAADQSTFTGRLEFDTGNLVWHLDGMRREWNNLDIPGFATDPVYLDPDHAGEEDSVPGFIPNTGGETESTTLGVSRIFANGFVGLAVSRLDNIYGLPPGSHGDHEEEGAETAEEENIFIDMARTRYDATGEWRNPTAFIEHIDYRLAYTDYGHVEMEGPGMPGTRFSNDSWQQRLQLTHMQRGNWHGVTGLQTSDETFGAVGEESFIPVTRIDSRGLFLVEDYHAENFTLEIGARVNRDSYKPEDPGFTDLDYTTLSYSASVLWDMHTTASLGLTWSRAQRAPAIEELYSNFGLTDPEACVIHFATGACEIGDTRFTEETSNNLDVTLYLDRGNISATITAFYNQFDDYIGLVATGNDVDGFPVRNYRQMDARFSGLEVDVTFMLSDFMTLEVFGDTISGRLDGNGDAPRMPPSRLGSRFTYNGNDWSGFVSVMNGARQDDTGRYELPTDSYTRWDIGIDYTISYSGNTELMLFGRSRNFSDEEVRLSTSTLRGFAPEAGRSLEVGLRFRY